MRVEGRQMNGVHHSLGLGCQRPHRLQFPIASRCRVRVPIPPPIHRVDSTRIRETAPFLHFLPVYAQVVSSTPVASSHVEAILRARRHSAGIVKPVAILLLSTPQRLEPILQHLIRLVRTPLRPKRKGHRN